MKKLLIFLLYIGCLLSSCDLFYNDVSGYLDTQEVLNDYVGADLVFRLLDDGTYSISGVGSQFSGTLTIPEYHNGKLVVAIDSYAFKDNSRITAVYIFSNITIGKAAFQGCSNLKAFVSPHLQNSVSESMFESCTSLEVVDIGTHVTTINDSAFADCKKITSIIIPHTVDNISSSSFTACEMLKVYVDDAKPTSGYGDAGWDSDIIEVYYDGDWCNITFDSKGGNYISPMAVNAGATVEDFPKPSKNGYNFVGWYIDLTFSGKTVNSVTAGNKGEDVLLFARWE